MISFDAPFDNHEVYTATPRRRLYLLEQLGSKAYLSEMEVSGTGEIGEASVISPETFIEALREAQQPISKANKDFLDPRILVKTSDKLVWTYTPSASQPFYYRHNGRQLAKPICWPTFVFKRQDARLSVRVVQHRTRPTLNTRLYHAPLANVYEGGMICLGSCVLPNTDDIDVISEEYLNSIKTHMNFRGGFRHTKEVSDKEYFQYLKRKTKEKIKVSELTPCGTLKDFI